MHDFRRNSVQRPRQTCAEQSIYDDAAVPQIVGRQCLNGAIPSLGHFGRIALPTAGRKRLHHHMTTTLFQIAGGTEAIATIISGSAEHKHIARSMTHHGIGNCPPGIFHQCNRRHSGGVRQMIGFGCFFHRQEFGTHLSDCVAKCLRIRRAASSIRSGVLQKAKRTRSDGGLSL